MPNIPDDEQTLYPKPAWRGAKFEPAITVTSNDGSQHRFDQCANKAKATTDKIQKLAPKPHGSMVLFTIGAFVISLIVIGGFCYWLGGR